MSSLLDGWPTNMAENGLSTIVRFWHYLGVVSPVVPGTPACSSLGDYSLELAAVGILQSASPFTRLLVTFSSNSTSALILG